jgi:hypothetical protein
VGALLLKTGKVNFKTIEGMVHEQIRKAIQDFSVWQNVDFTFLTKDIKPFDEIHLPVYEFLPPDVVRSAVLFVDGLAKAHGTSGVATASSLPAV